jgi:hypothetical protein
MLYPLSYEGFRVANPKVVGAVPNSSARTKIFTDPPARRAVETALAATAGTYSPGP